MTIAGAAGLALPVPVANLIIRLPIALVVRGIVELAGWAVGVVAS